MTIVGLFKSKWHRKPKWQRSNPTTRKSGIAELKDPVILNLIAEVDPNDTVREATKERLNDLREAEKPIQISQIMAEVQSGDIDALLQVR